MRFDQAGQSTGEYPLFISCQRLVRIAARFQDIKLEQTSVRQSGTPELPDVINRAEQGSGVLLRRGAGWPGRCGLP